MTTVYGQHCNSALPMESLSRTLDQLLQQVSSSKVWLPLCVSNTWTVLLLDQKFGAKKTRSTALSVWAGTLEPPFHASPAAKQSRPLLTGPWDDLITILSSRRSYFFSAPARVRASACVRGTRAYACVTTCAHGTNRGWGRGRGGRGRDSRA